MISQETNRYSVQKNPNRPFPLLVTTLKKYLGILVMMSVVKLNNIRSYWSPVIGNNVIIETMSVNKFEDIRRFLHFNNNEHIKANDHPDYDRLFRLRPLINYLRNKYKSVPLESDLSIDEQICSTKVKHFMKQYNPMKPHKWGFKIFVLSGVSGYAYDFEIYSGQENKDRLPD